MGPLTYFVHLALDAPRLSGAVYEVIVRNRRLTVPALIRVLRSALSQPGHTSLAHAPPRERRGPARAVDILVDLRSGESIEPMFCVLVGTGVATMIHERIVHRLPELGVCVMNPALEYLRRAGSLEVRLSICMILVRLGVRDQRVFDVLVAFFREDAELGSSLLADYGDPRAVEVLSAAVEQFEPNWLSPSPLAALGMVMASYEDLVGAALPPRLVDCCQRLEERARVRAAGGSGELH